MGDIVSRWVDRRRPRARIDDTIVPGEEGDGEEEGGGGVKVWGDLVKNAALHQWGGTGREGNHLNDTKTTKPGRLTRSEAKAANMVFKEIENTFKTITQRTKQTNDTSRRPPGKKDLLN